MKFNPGRAPTGLCYVCGRPTKLLIHAKCGKSCDTAKTQKTGFGNFTVQHAETARHNTIKKKWSSGKKLPPWILK